MLLIAWSFLLNYVISNHGFVDLWSVGIPLIELSMAQSIDRVIVHSIRGYTYECIWMERLRVAVVVGHVLHVVHLIGPYILIMANILLPFCILSVPLSFVVSPGPRNSCILSTCLWLFFFFFRLVNVWFLGPFFAKFRFLPVLVIGLSCQHVLVQMDRWTDVWPGTRTALNLEYFLDMRSLN